MKRILVEQKEVLGVELDSGKKIRANIVISNADPGATFGQLIGKDKLSPDLKQKVDSVLTISAGKLLLEISKKGYILNVSLFSNS